MTSVHLTGYGQRVTSTVGSFIANLPEMLGAMAVDPRTLIAVVEFEDERYVQFWVGSDGLVIAEVVSNLNIGTAVALSDADEAYLRGAGWREPSPGPNPNWRVDAIDAAGVLRVVALTRDAVVQVLNETMERTVSMRTWSVSERGERTADDERYEARVHYQEALRSIELLFDEE
jgi:hypothetical protein